MAKFRVGCTKITFAGSSTEAAKVTAHSPKAVTTVLRSVLTKPRSASTTMPQPAKCQSWTPSTACNTSKLTLQMQLTTLFAAAVAWDL
jgi:hypothetical protein